MPTDAVVSDEMVRHLQIAEQDKSGIA